MKNRLTIKFSFSKWWLTALLSFFIFLTAVPSFANQGKILVRTEQRDVARSARPLLILTVESCRPRLKFLCSENYFFSSRHCTSLIQIKLKKRTEKRSGFKPIVFALLSNYRLRSGNSLPPFNLG